MEERDSNSENNREETHFRRITVTCRRSYNARRTRNTINARTPARTYTRIRRTHGGGRIVDGRVRRVSRKICPIGQDANYRNID